MTKKGYYQCPICGETRTNILTMNAHIRSEHQKIKLNPEKAECLWDQNKIIITFKQDLTFDQAAMVEELLKSLLAKI